MCIIVVSVSQSIISLLLRLKRKTNLKRILQSFAIIRILATDNKKYQYQFGLGLEFKDLRPKYKWFVDGKDFEGI